MVKATRHAECRVVLNAL